MSIHKKVFELLSEIDPLKKTGENPHFKSRYFDINQLIHSLKPLLIKHKLLLLQPIIDNKQYSIIMDIDNTDDKIESYIQLPNEHNPQKLGSAITYYRRYTLASLLGLEAVDDDANLISVEDENTHNSKPKSDNNQKQDKKWFNPNTKEWNTALEKEIPLETVKIHYLISKQTEKAYLEELTRLATQ